MSATDWLLLIALSILWGGSFYFAKVAVLEIPPLTLALGRVLIAGAVIAVLIRPLGGSFPRDLADLADVHGAGGAQQRDSVHADLWGQQHIPIGLASILNATSPLFTVVVAHFVTHDDKLTPGRAVRPDRRLHRRGGADRAGPAERTRQARLGAARAAHRRAFLRARRDLCAAAARPQAGGDRRRPAPDVGGAAAAVRARRSTGPGRCGRCRTPRSGRWCRSRCSRPRSPI